MSNPITFEQLFTDSDKVLWSGHSWGDMKVEIIHHYNQETQDTKDLELKITIGRLFYQKAVLYAMLNPEGRTFHGMRIVYGPLPNPTVSLVYEPDIVQNAVKEDGSDAFPERVMIEEVRRQLDPDYGHWLLTRTKCEAKAIEERLVAPLMTQILAWAKEMRQLIGILQRIDTPDTDYDWDDYYFSHIGLKEDEEEPAHEPNPPDNGRSD